MADILITGGAGFIGSNLANSLSKSGDYRIVVVDNLFLGRTQNLNLGENTGIEFIQMGVEDPELGDTVFSTNNFDYVFHMAALSSAPMFMDRDRGSSKFRRWVRVNLQGFSNVMDACIEYSVKKAVYASTSSIYSGNPLPYREDQLIKPRTIYEASLYCRELIARAYTETYGFPTVGMRYFAVYGNNEMHKGPYANLVSQFLWAMQKHERPVIYGDGTQTRDFTFIDDVTHANILAIRSEMCGVYNVGTGTSYNLLELVNILNRKLNTNIKPKFVQNPLKNYVVHTQADISKIKSHGYEPQVSLEEGIEKLIAHSARNYPEK